MKNPTMNLAKRELSLYKGIYSLIFVHTFLLLLVSLNVSAATLYNHNQWQLDKHIYVVGR